VLKNRVMSTKDKEDLMLKLKTEELNIKTEELKHTSNSLLASNDELRLKTEELANTHAELFESNHQLASVNKELAITNKRFADTNRRFAQVIEELSAANKELARVNNELTLANEQIKSRQEITKEFINIAAHELRTPTQSILGYSELLQQILFEEEEKEQVIETNSANIASTAKELDEQKKKALDSIVRNVTRLDRLEKQILDITKIESNTLTLDKERFSLTEKIQDMVADVIANEMRRDDTGYDKKNIKIEFETEAGAERGGEGEEEKNIFIDADKTKVYQVISNLLRNAIKFASKYGVITITTDVIAKQTDADSTVGAEGGGEGQVVVVKIKDNGTGIAANILPKLFTKFATSSSEGIGLGLYVSKKIVEAHGGRIWAENNLDGKGATFAFSLPAL
jgi:signal transduction histidine kinase